MHPIIVVWLFHFNNHEWRSGPARGGGGEISPGGTLKGRQNHVGKYGIGLNFVKLAILVKKFTCGTIFDFFTNSLNFTIFKPMPYIPVELKTWFCCPLKCRPGRSPHHPSLVAGPGLIFLWYYKFDVSNLIHNNYQLNFILKFAAPLRAPPLENSTFTTV